MKVSNNRTPIAAKSCIDAGRTAVDFIRDGGVVLMCGPCMQEVGLTRGDLVDGVLMGQPGITQSFIFAENARTLTW